MIVGFNENELDVLSCLIEHEIDSNTDYLNDISEKEKPYWKEMILTLKNIKEKLVVSTTMEMDIGRYIAYEEKEGEIQNERRI